MQCRGLNLLVASVLGSMMLPGLLGATADTPTPAVDELSALRAEVAALRSSAADRDATLRRLEARNAELESGLQAVNQAVALASSESAPRRGQAGSPSSTLDWSSALKVATAARFMVKGSSVLTVMPTGSMKPVFDERALLLMEPAKFDDLQIGDIVTYQHPRYGLPVVHRILEKRGDKFWAKGDNNGRMDEVYITRQNYQARVFGIIYARETSDKAPRISPAFASR